MVDNNKLVEIITKINHNNNINDLNMYFSVFSLHNKNYIYFNIIKLIYAKKLMKIMIIKIMHRV